MLNKLQSKVTIILVSLAVLCLSSCGNSLSVNKTNLAIDIPAQVFQQVAARTAYSEKGLPLSANVELFVDGKSYALDSQNYQEGEEASVLFRFKNIPVDSKAYAKVSIIQDDLELAQGDSVTITVKAGTNKIEVPLALIKYSVPKTKYVLYKSHYDNNINADLMDCYICNSSDAKITDADEPDFKNVLQYCFDKEGFVYAVVARQTKYGEPPDEYWMTEYYLESNKNDFESQLLYDANSMNMLTQLFCDIVTNKIYVMYSQEGNYYLIDVYGNTEKYGELTGCLPKQPEDWNAKPYSIISYDSNAYCLYKTENESGGDYYLVKMNLFEAETLQNVEVSSPMEIKMNLDQFPGLSLELNNMIYQDGYFYIFANIRPKEISAICYFGGILRVNYEEPEIKVLGFSTDVYTLQDRGRMRVYGNFDATHPVYKSNKTDYLSYTYSELMNYVGTYPEYAQSSAQAFKEVYTPKNAGSTKLFGSNQIVALKPKRLILSDEGKFFFVDTDGYWKYKNAKRVITVDLDTFAIKDIVQANIKDNESLYCVDEIHSTFISSLSAYYDPENASEFQPITLSNDNGWYFYIPPAND